MAKFFDVKGDRQNLHTACPRLTLGMMGKPTSLCRQCPGCEGLLNEGLGPAVDRAVSQHLLVVAVSWRGRGSVAGYGGARGPSRRPLIRPHSKPRDGLAGKTLRVSWARAALTVQRRCTTKF
jgi:hypothetical protein